MVLVPLRLSIAETMTGRTPKLAGKFDRGARHPVVEMHPKRRHVMGERKKQPARKKPEPERIGGREFGNVIEPMQAQMASGNQGLAVEPEKPKRKTAGKKAA
jgi:hypothetical protein